MRPPDSGSRDAADANNAELANDLGNLVNRTVSMAGRYLDGELPPLVPPRDADAELAAAMAGAAERHHPRDQAPDPQPPQQREDDETDHQGQPAAARQRQKIHARLGEAHGVVHRVLHRAAALDRFVG